MKNSQYLLYFSATRYINFQSLDISLSPSREWPCTVSDDGLGPIVSRAIDRTLEAGALAFRREIMLPRLLPVGPDDIADRSVSGRLRMVRRLAMALRGERTRGRAGHWTYSLNRHVGLLQAFKAERAALRMLYPAAKWSAPRAGGGALPADNQKAARK